MGVLNNATMRTLWKRDPSQRPTVPSGTPQGAYEHLVMGYKPSAGFDNVEYAASIMGGLQALVQAGYPTPEITATKDSLRKDFLVIQKEVIKRKIEPLAFAYRGILIANKVQVANAATAAVASILAALGTVTYGITTGIAAIIGLIAGIKNAELLKAAQGLGLVVEAWTTEIDKKRAKALGLQTQSVEDTLQKAAVFQQQLIAQYQQMQRDSQAPQLAPVSSWGIHWPWYVAGVGGFGLLIAAVSKKKREA